MRKKTCIFLDIVKILIHQLIILQIKSNTIVMNVLSPVINMEKNKNAKEIPSMELMREDAFLKCATAMEHVVHFRIRE